MANITITHVDIIKRSPIVNRTVLSKQGLCVLHVRVPAPGGARSSNKAAPRLHPAPTGLRELSPAVHRRAGAKNAKVLAIKAGPAGSV